MHKLECYNVHDNLNIFKPKTLNICRIASEKSYQRSFQSCCWRSLEEKKFSLIMNQKFSFFCCFSLERKKNKKAEIRRILKILRKVFWKLISNEKFGKKCKISFIKGTILMLRLEVFLNFALFEKITIWPWKSAIRRGLFICDVDQFLASHALVHKKIIMPVW